MSNANMYFSGARQYRCYACGSLWNNGFKGAKGKSFFCSKCGFATRDLELKKRMELPR